MTKKEEIIPRKEIRRVLGRIYNNRSTLTTINSKGKKKAFLDVWNRKREPEEISHDLAWRLIHQNLVDLDSGNDYYGEENYVCNNENIETIYWAIRFDEGDTVECDFEREHVMGGRPYVLNMFENGQIQQVLSEPLPDGAITTEHQVCRMSGFITGCLPTEWSHIYVNGLLVSPVRTTLKRMVLTEKVNHRLRLTYR